MMKKSLVATMCICVRDVMIASPEKIFYKSWDASKMEEVYYKTCKDCREKRRVSAKVRYDKDKDKINEKRREYKKNI